MVSDAKPRFSDVIEHDLNRLYFFNACEGMALGCLLVADLSRKSDFPHIGRHSVPMAGRENGCVQKPTILGRAGVIRRP